jgi:hypothetical protein
MPANELIADIHNTGSHPSVSWYFELTCWSVPISADPSTGRSYTVARADVHTQTRQTILTQNHLLIRLFNMKLQAGCVMSDVDFETELLSTRCGFFPGQRSG